MASPYCCAPLSTGGPATLGPVQNGLRGATVFVYEAAEHVDAAHVVGSTKRRRRHRNRRLQIDAAMRPSMVVMPQVLAQHLVQVALVLDQGPVQTVRMEGRSPGRV